MSDDHWNDAVQSDLWDRLRTGDWLDAQTFPPLRYAVPGVIPEGFGLLAAPPKAGKSWLAFSILLDVARGARALGGIDTGEPRAVLYMALEDGDRRLQGRARKLLGDGVAIPAKFHYVTDARPDEVSGLIREWLDVHGENSPLVVLDTLGKVLPPAAQGQGAYERDYAIGGTMKRLVDAHPGASLVAVHHTRKQGAEDYMDSVSGTNGLNGSADFTLILTRARNSDEGTLKVTGRDVLESEYALTVNDGLWSLAGGSLADARQAAEQAQTTDGVGDVSQKVIAAVMDAPNGITPKGIASVVPEIKDNDMAGKYLRRLVRSERIRADGRGKYLPIPLLSEVSEPSESDQTTRSEQGSDSDTPSERVSESPRVSESASSHSDTPDTRVSERNVALTRESDTSDTSDTPPQGDAEQADALDLDSLMLTPEIPTTQTKEGTCSVCGEPSVYPTHPTCEGNAA